MKPWHLLTKEQRADVIDTLDFRHCGKKRCGNVHCAPARAAIALLESACEFDDEALVVDVAGNAYWVEDWVETTGVCLYLVSGFGRYANWFVIDYCTPLTPAAASLLDALRGER